MLHHIELNIGLNTNKGGNIGPATALQATCDVFAPSQIVTRNAYAASGELTMVISMQSCIKPNDNTIGRLCAMLAQDCIAGKLGGKGFLIGPNTEPYGNKFDYRYWLEPATLPKSAHNSEIY